ncbi:MAG: class II fructose-bisphosphate aldolase [Rubrobacteraceae bacterium]
MPLVRDARALYSRAYDERFAMPAFNVCNLEMAQGVLEAAESERAPVILQTYPGDLVHGGSGLAPMLGTLGEEAGVPVILHLDHGQGPEMVIDRLRGGYSSVMFDGGELPLDENISRTSRIAEIAHAFGAAVEGEVGLFGGDHGSVAFTDPEEAERFVAESGTDTLAVSVGSEHHQKSRLDLARLEEIASRTNCPLVLHGGSGIHPDDGHKAVAMGVAKINIGHAISLAMTRGACEALGADLDHYQMLEVMRNGVCAVAREKLQAMKATDRA